MRLQTLEYYLFASPSNSLKLPLSGRYDTWVTCAWLLPPAKGRGAKLQSFMVIDKKKTGQNEEEQRWKKGVSSQGLATVTWLHSFNASFQDKSTIKFIPKDEIRHGKALVYEFMINMGKVKQINWTLIDMVVLKFLLPNLSWYPYINGCLHVNCWSWVTSVFANFWTENCSHTHVVYTLFMWVFWMWFWSSIFWRACSNYHDVAEKLEMFKWFLIFPFGVTESENFQSWNQC